MIFSNSFSFFSHYVSSFFLFMIVSCKVKDAVDN
jgi:hypothetical protein